MTEIPPILVPIALSEPPFLEGERVDCHTVMFTGSNTLWRRLEGVGCEVRKWHARPEWMRYLRNGRHIATSYRDPYRTAASWLNRGKPLKYLWPQWAWWLNEIVPRAHWCSLSLDARQADLANYTEDRLGFHVKLDAGDTTWAPEPVHNFVEELWKSH